MRPAVEGRGRRAAGGFLVALALVAAALTIAPPEAEAQNVNFCSRTAEVVSRIRQKLSLPAWECSASPSSITGSFIVSGVTSLQSGDFDGMSGVTNLLIITSSQLTSLPASPFDEMTSLTLLSLGGTGLTSLPTGMFDNQDGLTRIYLPNRNPPFTLDVKAEQHSGQVRARIDEAAPLPVSVTWTASGGSTATGTATIAAGMRTSAAFGTAASQDVTVTLSSPTFTGVIESTSDSAGDYRNFQLGVSSSAASATIPATVATIPEIASTLILSSSSILETGGVSTVTATLAEAVSEAVTVTVAATGATAAAGDFSLSSATTLTIAAGATTSTGTVTVTAVADTTAEADETVTVSGMVSGDGVADPSPVTLTLEDDEALPTVTLALSSSSISEGGGVTTVTAALSGVSSEAVMVTVSAAPLSGAAVADYALSTNKTLTIAAGSTASAGTVTLTAVNNNVGMEADKTVTVSGAASGGNGVSAPAGLTLTITDNDGSVPTGSGTTWRNVGQLGTNWDVTTMSLVAKTASQTIAFTGGYDQQNVDVWACANKRVTQRAHTGIPGPSSTECTKLANDIGSARSVTIVLTQAMIDNDGIVILFTAEWGGSNVIYFNTEWLPIVALPKATLSLSPSSISESGGVSTVTATLDKAALSAATLTVSVPAGDLTLSAAATLTFATGGTASTGTVTVTAVSNTIDAPDKRVSVSAAASGDVRAPPDATLTIRDDEALPTVTLALSPMSISESSGVSTVTATLLGASSEAVTVTVGAAAGTGAIPADFTLSSAKTLTIAAGDTASAGAVTVTANGNAVDSPNKQVTVSGTASGGNGVAAPSSRTLTLTDDETLPTVMLVLSPASISESSGVSTVTAALSGASSEAVTVTVGAAPGTGAIAADFALSGTTTLTIAAGDTTSAGAVTVTANDNDVDVADKPVTVSGTVAGGNGVAAPPNVTLTLTDDDTAGFAVSPSTSTTSRLGTTEDGGTATFTVKLESEPTGDVVLGVASTDTAEGTVSPSSLTFETSDWSTAQTVTLTGVDDAPANPVDGDRNYTVTLTVNEPSTADDTYDGLSAVTVYAVNADNEYGLDVSSVTGQATEAGGTATFTVALATRPLQAVTVSVTSRDTGEGAASPSSLTFETSDWSTAQTVTVTGADDAIDDGEVTWDVRLDPSSGDANYNGLSNVDVSVTTTDDDAAPGVTLSLSASSISESGGVSTVTATLSRASGTATTVTVTAVSGFYTVGSDAVIVIAAGETANAADTATIAAADNDTDAPDRAGTVTATVSNARATADGTTLAVSGGALTVTDDDAAPGATLALSASSIGESGTSNVSTVTATLSHPSSAATTVTVTASPGAGTDFTLTGTTLTIAAGDTTSAGTVTITADDDDTDSPDKSVTVSGTLGNSQGTGAVTGATLTITDDDAAPGATLALSASSIGESGTSNVSTVTATLSHPSSAATTVTVSASPGAGTDFTLTGTTLTIAAGDTTSAGTVTITADDDDTDSPDKSVTVSGTMGNSQGTGAVTGATLTITDDDALPTVALVLSASSISEDGGVSTVTATLSGVSSEAVTVTVGAAAGTGAVAADFTLSSAKTLTIASGSTTSAGAVTVTANDNDVDVADKSVTVSGTAAGGNGVAAPSNVTLTLTDDDTAGVTFNPTAVTVTEEGAGKKFTVVLDSEPELSPGQYVFVGLNRSDSEISLNNALTYPLNLSFDPSNWSTAQTVTVTALGDSDTQDETKSIKYIVIGYGAANVLPSANRTAVTVTVIDDDKPVVSLSLSESSISENGGVATVTATLDRTATEATTVTVSAAAVSPAVSDDFGLSSANTLTIASGSTTSTGTVTVAAADNATDAPDKSVTVSATVAGGNGAANPSDATLTIADDEDAPGVTLTLSESSISESGGGSTVTATLSHPSSAATTVTVTAVSGFYTVGSDATIVIAAGETANAADTATIAAVDNDTDAPDRAGTVTATVSNDVGTGSVGGGALTVTDDDAAPNAALSLNPASVSENGGASAVSATLTHPSSEPTTVTVTAVSGSYTVGSDATIVIAAGSTAAATDTAAITAVDNTKDEPDRTATVTATLGNSQGTGTVSGATLTLTDDDAAPGVTLSVASSSIPENGGSTTVSATLTHPSSAATTITVTPTTGVYAIGRRAQTINGIPVIGPDSTIVIAAGQTANATDTAAIAAVNDDVDNVSNRSVTVTGTAANAQATAESETMTVTGASLTITDDDTAGFVVSPSTSTTSRLRTTESGGTATFEVKLSSEPTGDVVLGVVSSDTTEGTVSASSLTFTATTWNTAQTVTVTGVDDAPANPADGDRNYTVTLTVNMPSTVDPKYDALSSSPVTVYAVNADNEHGLDVSEVTGQATEAGGQATFTVALMTRPSAAVTVSVSSRDASEGAASPSSLTFAATAWNTAQTVTVTGADDAIDDGEVTWDVRLDPSSGDANYNRLSNVDVSVTTTDDDAAPGVTLALSPSSISESGGISTVTATLSHPSSAATTVTVTAVSGFYTVGSDATIVIAAGETANATDTAMVAAVDNTTDAPDRAGTVTATITNDRATADGTTLAVSGGALTVTDDDAAPGATLALSASSIGESGTSNVSTVTATLSHPSSAATTVTVTASPGAGTDFTLTGTTLTIAAGDTTSAGTVTITADDDDTDSPDKSVTVSGTMGNSQGTGAVTGATLTITDDDAAPGATLALTASSIGESGTSNISTVTATLSHPSSAATTVTVTASPGAGTDFTLTGTTLTIAAGDTTSSGTVTITADDDDTDSPDKSVTVSGTMGNSQGTGAVTGATLTITDDEAAPGVTLSASPASISENGGVSTVTAKLSHPSSAATTVTVTAVSGFYTVGSDAVIVIAAGQTANATDTATIAAVDNTTDAPDRAGTVTVTVSNDVGAGTVSGGALTVTDDDAAPGVTLSLPYPSIPESNASTSVSATLTHPSSAATTVTVTAVSGFYTVGSDAVIVIAAGSTAAASDTVTITAVDNDTDEPDRTVTLTATVDNDQGEGTVSGATLTLTDNDAAPGVTLTVASSSIPENGGSTTVGATLTHPSSAATTVTVTAVSGSYTVGSDATITIAAGETANATDTASITAVDNDVDAADSAVTVTGTAQNSQGAGTVTGASLTITDDDTAGFAVSPATSSTSRLRTTEDGGTDTFTVKLSSKPTGDVVLGVVSSDATEGTVSASSLTFTATTWSTAQTVTLTGVDDAPANPADGDKDYTVTLTVDQPSTADANYDALSSSPVTVYAVNADNEYGLKVSSVTGQATEAGGTATFTVALATRPLQAVTVSVTSRDTGEGTVSPSSLTFETSDWNTTQAVTATGVDDAIDDGDVTWDVRLDPSSAAADYNGLANVDVSVTTTDDDAAPGVVLSLSPSSISENGGVSTVTAKLSHPSGAATTVTVTAVSGFYTVGSDAVIVIAAGQTANATDTATVAAVNNNTDAPDRAGTVTATITNDRATADGTTLAVSGGALTVTDDDAAPNAALSLNPASVSENGGASAVSATLTHPSSAATTVTVTPVSGSYTVGSDAVIVIAAGQTANATDTAAIAGVDNTKDEPDRTATVTATLGNSQGTGTVSGATLTLEDDDDAPNAELSLNPASVSENGGASAVSATLSHLSSAATTVTVTAVSGSYTVGSDATIVIAAGSTANATDTAAITAVDNTTDEPDRTATVTATLGNSQGTGTVSGATLTLTDDDDAPGVTLTVSPSSISENGGVSTVTATLAHPSSAATTVTVTAVSGFYTVGSDAVIVIAAGQTANATDTATVAAVNNDTDAPDRAGTVTATVTNDRATADGMTMSVGGGALTVTDDDDAPNAELSLNPASVSENGGASAVSATLTHPSSAATTVTVTAVSGSYTVGSDATIVIAAGSTANATDTAAIAAVDNTTDEPDRTATVTATLSNSQGTGTVSGATLTLTDDDAAPGVALTVSPSSISENGGGATVTATLAHPSSAATTVTVTAVSGFYTVGSDAVIVIAAGATANATDTATIAAVNNDTDAPDRAGTVTATVTNDRATADGMTMSVGGGALTVTDDDAAPNAALSLNPASVSENGGASAVSATLTHPSSAATTVTVTAVSGSYTVGSDATIVIAAGETANATDTAAITAVDNTKDEPDRTATVTATLGNSQGTGTVSGATLTLTDDDAAPGVTLSVASSSIPENGGSTTVSATLTHPSVAATTVTVTAVSGSYTVGPDVTIVIAAGSTASTDTAAIAAVNDDVDNVSNRSVTVTGTAANSQAAANSETMTVTGASLTLTDDDTAGLAVSPATTASSRLRTTESGGTDTFTVKLSSEPTGDVVLGVASSHTTEGTVSTSSLTFTATTWSTAQTVTLTGVDDSPTLSNPNPSAGNRPYTVTLTVNATSTADDNYDALASSPVMVYAVNADNEYGLDVGTVTGQATEAGGTATFTVALVTQPSAAVTVSVTSRDTSEGAASPSSLTFATTAWNTAQTVTVTGADDAIDDGDVTWAVRLDPSSGDANYDGLSNVDVSVTTTDDDGVPGVVLVLSPSSISESGGAATVTARLTHPSGAATTVTVTPVSGFYTVGSDATITIAAGSTANASDTATITAVNDDVHQGAAGRSTTVTATVANSMGAGSVSGGALTLADDEAAPGAELALSAASISENGGTSVVSATLSGKSAAATTVTVTPVSGAYTVGSDATIVIAAGSTAAASDTVTITAVNNDTDEPDRTATVTGTVASGLGAGTVSGATLTLTDDDAAPGVTLVVASSSIPENGGSTTVSATLTHRSSAATTVTVTPVSGSYTVASGVGATIVIAAGSTASTDTVAIAAVNDDVDNVSNRSVTVVGTAANAQAATNSETMTVTGASLTLTDDDTAGLAVSPVPSASSPLRTTESGGTDTFTVKLSSRPTGDVVLGVVSSDTTEGTVSASSLTFTATTWNTAQTVTVTGVDDAPANPADGNRDYTVTLTVDQPSTADAKYDALSSSPVIVYARNADNEFGLDVGTVAGQATEGGGKATFTVALIAQPSAAVTVSVTSRDTSEGTVSPSSLTFETSDWSTARTVTVTGVDDATDDGDVAWAVRLDTSSGGDASYDGLDDEDVSVTTTDDDAAPAARLVLTPSSISESGGVSTVSATLSHPSVAATTVTVAPAPVAPAVADDYTLTGTTLTIAAGSMASVGTVTIAAKNNDVDAADKTVTVSGTAQNTRAAADSTAVAVTPAMLTITDDDEKGFAFAPSEFVEVTEGGAPVAYMVALTSEPDGAVAVAVAAGDTFLEVTPPSLTFDAANWRQAQTVTVTARDDGNDVAESSSVSHTASGGGYGGVSGSLPVSVAGETTVRTSAASGTTTYVIERRQVVVTVMAGVPEGIVVDFAGVGSVAAETVPTMTIAPSRAVPAAIVTRAAGDGFNLGPEGSRTVVDLEVTDAPGVGVCLPVNAAVAIGAGDDGRLRLIRHDGSAWAPVAGAEYDAAMRRICAPGVTAFSPFATGYADTQPAFDFTLPPLVFTVDEAIEPVTLPLVKEGTGDPPVKYALTPGPESLPQGLDFDYETQMLSGTPTEESAREDYVWTATDRDDEVASLPLSIEVKPALAKARARLKSLNESVLPELLRAMWGSAVDVVTDRLEGSGPGGGMADTVAEALRAHERSQDEEGLTWRKVLEGRTFAVGLGAGGGEGGLGSGGSGSGSAVVWGGGSLRSLSLDKEALDWSGDLFSAHMGVDAPLGESLRGGLAATWFEGEIEYTDRSGEAAVTGVHESRMTAVHPYLGWSGPDGSRLWGMLGYGEGEIEIADAEVMERFGVQKSDSELVGAALGGSVPVLTSLGGLRVALKGSGEAARYSVDDNGEAIAAVSVDTHRLRLSVEGSRAYVLSGGGTLTPSLEVGGRWDGGDGETGAGVELGVGVEWALPSRGLVVEARGRTLAAHAGAVEDWGVSGSARLLPGPGGRGPSFELSPGWGASESGFGRLWSEGVAGRASSDEGGEEGAARLGAELGYGFGVWGGAGVVTPHAGFGYEEGGDRRYRLGVRLELGPSLEAGLQAGRAEGAADPEHDVKLNLRLMW